MLLASRRLVAALVLTTSGGCTDSYDTFFGGGSLTVLLTDTESGAVLVDAVIPGVDAEWLDAQPRVPGPRVEDPEGFADKPGAGLGRSMLTLSRLPTGRLSLWRVEGEVVLDTPIDLCDHQYTHLNATAQQMQSKYIDDPDRVFVRLASPVESDNDQWFPGTLQTDTGYAPADILVPTLSIDADDPAEGTATTSGEWLCSRVDPIESAGLRTDLTLTWTFDKHVRRTTSSVQGVNIFGGVN